MKHPATISWCKDWPTSYNGCLLPDQLICRIWCFNRVWGIVSSTEPPLIPPGHISVARDWKQSFLQYVCIRKWTKNCKRQDTFCLVQALVLLGLPSRVAEVLFLNNCVFVVTVVLKTVSNWPTQCWWSWMPSKLTTQPWERWAIPEHSRMLKSRQWVEQDCKDCCVT